MITIGLSDNVKKKSVTIPGICRYAKINANALEAAIKNKTIETVRNVFFNIVPI